VPKSLRMANYHCTFDLQFRNDKLSLDLDVNSNSSLSVNRQCNYESSSSGGIEKFTLYVARKHIPLSLPSVAIFISVDQRC
jgi:hypothetical protein